MVHFYSELKRNNQEGHLREKRNLKLKKLLLKIIESETFYKIYNLYKNSKKNMLDKKRSVTNKNRFDELQNEITKLLQKHRLVILKT